MPLVAQQPNTLTPDEGELGWKLLFDGNSATQWRGPAEGPFPSSWEVADGTLRAVARPFAGTDLISVADYDNFEFSADWMVPQGGNSGIKYLVDESTPSPYRSGLYIWVGVAAVLCLILALPPAYLSMTRRVNGATALWLLRALSLGSGVALMMVLAAGVYFDRVLDQSTTGLEMQVLDDANHPDGQRGPKYVAGALYDILPVAKTGLARPAGQWNTSRIVVKGNQVEHWLNGEKVVGYELGSTEFLLIVSRSKLFGAIPGFGRKKPGHLVLQHHGEQVSYRNLKIRLF